MKVGIVIDSYKLAVFDELIKAAGMTYVNGGSPVADTILLTIESTMYEVPEMVEKIRDINDAARRIHEQQRHNNPN